MLEWFDTRHSDVLRGIVDTGKFGDEEALQAAIAAFTDQFQGSDSSSDPEVEAQGDASTKMVDATNTLPEADVSRSEA